MPYSMINLSGFAGCSIPRCQMLVINQLLDEIRPTGGEGWVYAGLYYYIIIEKVISAKCCRVVFYKQWRILHPAVDIMLKQLDSW